jgi:chromosome partitioning protein
MTSITMNLKNWKGQLMNKPITITTSQRKGGVGKSTSTLNLACVLAEQGHKVLIIDLDDQQNTTRSISGIVKAEKTIEDLLLHEEVSLKETAVKTDWENVFILPASPNLSGVIKYLDTEVGGHLILKEKLSEDYEFDFILIDTSPSLNILVINALCASDYMFIPMSSKYLSVQGLRQTLKAFDKVTGRLNPDLKLLGIAIVYHDGRSVLANEIIDKLKDKYRKEMFQTVIGVNIRIEEAQVNKQSILSYSSIDRGSLQYRQLGFEILERIKSRTE